MKEGYVIRDQNIPHFITITIVDWIDVFSRKTYRDSVIASFEYCIYNKGMILYCYVIMSNHIHMIVQSSDGKLSDLIRDFKKYTAKTILEKIKTEPDLSGSVSFVAILFQVPLSNSLSRHLQQ